MRTRCRAPLAESSSSPPSHSRVRAPTCWTDWQFTEIAANDSPMRWNTVANTCGILDRILVPRGVPLLALALWLVLTSSLTVVALTQTRAHPTIHAPSFLWYTLSRAPRWRRRAARSLVRAQRWQTRSWTAIGTTEYTVLHIGTRLLRMRRWTDSAGYLPHEAEAHCIGYRRGGTAGGVDLIVTISVNAETGACKCKVRWRRHRTIACAAAAWIFDGDLSG